VCNPGELTVLSLFETENELQMDLQESCSEENAFGILDIPAPLPLYLLSTVNEMACIHPRYCLELELKVSVNSTRTKVGEIRRPVHQDQQINYICVMFTLHC
jgi:hypothetical protein